MLVSFNDAKQMPKLVKLNLDTVLHPNIPESDYIICPIVCFPSPAPRRKVWIRLRPCSCAFQVTLPVSCTHIPLAAGARRDGSTSWRTRDSYPSSSRSVTEEPVWILEIYIYIYFFLMKYFNLWGIFVANCLLMLTPGLGLFTHWISKQKC